MSKFRLNLNKQDSNNGNNYEVHEYGCHKYPTDNYKDLGEHSNCWEAMETAKQYIKPEYQYLIDGCKHCSKACNTD